MGDGVLDVWAVIRARVTTACLSSLNAAEVILPVKGTPDRALHLALPWRLLDEAIDVVNSLHSFVEEFIQGHVDILSGREINLLRAGISELTNYVMQDLPGADITIDVYKELYRNELRDLLSDQEGIVRDVLSRKIKTGTRRKAYWKNVPLTLGVEEEYQIVSTDGYALAPEVEGCLKNVKLSIAQLDGEVYRSQLELKTGVCDSVDNVAAQLLNSRKAIAEQLQSNLRLLSAGTHPFSSWNTQEASSSDRVDMFMHDMQDVVRRLLTFGMHVHVGVDDRDLAIAIMDAAKQFLPVLLGLSASSPFWEGRPTGLMSYRSMVFSVLPRTGIPPVFHSNVEFEKYLDLLTRTKSFDSVGSCDPTKIWWDLRLHPTHPTIEFRICDACTDVEDTIALAGCFQALVGRLAQMAYRGESLSRMPQHIIEENKWRAARYGRRARYIDTNSGRAVGSYYKVVELLDFLDETLVELGSARHVRGRLLKLVEEGGSADHQLAVYRATKSLPDVVRFMTDRFDKVNLPSPERRRPVS